jgi:hypothetical protein
MQVCETSSPNGTTKEANHCSNRQATRQSIEFVLMWTTVSIQGINASRLLLPPKRSGLHLSAALKSGNGPSRSSRRLPATYNTARLFFEPMTDGYTSLQCIIIQCFTRIHFTIWTDPQMDQLASEELLEQVEMAEEPLDRSV